MKKVLQFFVMQYDLRSRVFLFYFIGISNGNNHGEILSTCC